MGTIPRKPHQITKKAIRALTGSGTNAHTSPLLKELKLLSIINIHSSKLMCLFKQIRDKKVPIPIASLSKENKLTVSKPNSPRIKTYENTIRFELPTFLLNADSRLLDTEGTYQTFKINVKKLIIERYSTLCTKTGCKACYTPTDT